MCNRGLVGNAMVVQPAHSVSAQAYPGQTVAYFGLVTCNTSLVAKGTSVQNVMLQRPLVPYTQLQYITIFVESRWTPNRICQIYQDYLESTWSMWSKVKYWMVLTVGDDGWGAVFRIQCAFPDMEGVAMLNEE